MKERHSERGSSQEFVCGRARRRDGPLRRDQLSPNACDLSRRNIGALLCLDQDTRRIRSTRHVDCGKVIGNRLKILKVRLNSLSCVHGVDRIAFNCTQVGVAVRQQRRHFTFQRVQ